MTRRRNEERAVEIETHRGPEMLHMDRALEELGRDQPICDRILSREDREAGRRDGVVVLRLRELPGCNFVLRRHQRPRSEKRAGKHTP